MITPKFSNIIELGGTLAIAHFGPNGELIEDRFYSNIVVTVGKQWIASRMKDTGIPAQMSHMAVGTSSTPPASGDTTEPESVHKAATCVCKCEKCMKCVGMTKGEDEPELEKAASCDCCDECKCRSRKRGIGGA